MTQKCTPFQMRDYRSIHLITYSAKSTRLARFRRSPLSWLVAPSLGLGAPPYNAWCRDRDPSLALLFVVPVVLGF